MASITFDNVSKRYGPKLFAVQDLSLDIADGEFMVMVGPSGCGKSTALRMAAGLSDITDGELRIGDKRVNEFGARDRDIAMVFQNYALYPHMSVGENIAFPLAGRGLTKAEIDVKVRQAAGKLGLVEYLERRPKNLSGGQRQRVAMGRAIVRDPVAFLMDEPLSNLDAKLRNQMRAEIIDMQRAQGVTTLYVTHDQVEAMTMGDRIAIMRKGLLQQVGTPRELYDRPVNLFVAAFIGAPAMNLFEATLRLGDAPALALEEGTIPLGSGAALPAEARAYDGSRVVVGIRPENVQMGPPDGGVGTLPGRVALVEDLPPERLVHAHIAAVPPAHEALVEATADGDEAAGDITGDRGAGGGGARSRVIARMPIDTDIPESGPISLRIDPARMKLFDRASGATLR